MEHKGTATTSFRPLLIGFFSSLILLVFIYGVVAFRFLPESVEMPAVIFLGTLVAVLQIVYYFHVGLEPHSKWSILMLLFTILVTVLVIGGSMWIMYNVMYDLRL